MRIKSFRYLALSLLILTLGLSLGGCKKKVAQPPPPPPPPPAEAPKPPAPTITLTASPTTIERGQSATLTWSATNADKVTIEPGLGTVPTSGSRDVSPQESTTYTGTATGPGGTATATARVTVTVPPPPPPPARALTDEEIFQRDIRHIFFDFDKYEIRPDMRDALTRNAQVLKEHSNWKVTIEGHCDERGTEEYNLALGDRRATATKEFLVSLGISADRLNTISYGEEGSPNYRPAPGHNEDAWSQNRRAHFVLTGK